MDSATSYGVVNQGAFDTGLKGQRNAQGLPSTDDLEHWELLLSQRSSGRKKQPQSQTAKKRRRPLRKNRKPSRPTTHIGQRSNNRFIRVGRLPTES